MSSHLISHNQTTEFTSKCKYLYFIKASNLKTATTKKISQLLFLKSSVSLHHSSSLVRKKQVKVSYTQFAESEEQKKQNVNLFP